MGRLAYGDLDFGPVTTCRKDEIGDMEQAAEVFHKAAVRNRKLEADETERRGEAERERAKTQQAAEAEARLVRATSIFDASMQRLAAGDMMCELQPPLDTHFGTARHDFNAAVRQLRETLQSVGVSVTTVTGGSREVSSASDDLSRRIGTGKHEPERDAVTVPAGPATANAAATRRSGLKRRDPLDCRCHVMSNALVPACSIQAGKRNSASSLCGNKDRMSTCSHYLL